MSKLKQLLAVGLAALGLVAFQATPAPAAVPPVSTVAAAVFTGTATVTPGLSSPAGPPPPGQTGTWTLTGTGVGGHYRSRNVVRATVGAVSLNANGRLSAGIGNLGPFCGYSRGVGGTTPGTASVAPTIAQVPADGTVESAEFASVGWVQSAATIILATGRATDTTPAASGGTGESGNLIALVSAIPPVPGVIGTGSCLAGNATGFTVVGAAVFETDDGSVPNVDATIDNTCNALPVVSPPPCTP